MDVMILGLPDWSTLTDVYLIVSIALAAIALAAAKHCSNPVEKARQRANGR